MIPGVSLNQILLAIIHILCFTFPWCDTFFIQSLDLCCFIYIHARTCLLLQLLKGLDFLNLKTKNIFRQTVFSVGFPPETSHNLKGFRMMAFKNNYFFLNDLVLFVHEVTSLFLIEKG